MIVKSSLEALMFILPITDEEEPARIILLLHLNILDHTMATAD